MMAQRFGLYVGFLLDFEIDTAPCWLPVVGKTSTSYGCP